MLYGNLGLYRSMDKDIEPVDTNIMHRNRYLFTVVFHPSHGQKSTNGMYHFHKSVEYPWIFNAIATTSNTLFATSLTPPAAATLIIYEIITRTSDQLAYFIMSLPLRLLCLALVPRSMATLGSHSR